MHEEDVGSEQVLPEQAHPVLYERVLVLEPEIVLVHLYVVLLLQVYLLVWLLDYDYFFEKEVLARRVPLDELVVDFKSPGLPYLGNGRGLLGLVQAEPLERPPLVKHQHIKPAHVHDQYEDVPE